jgi:4-hydroxybenzoate polyprenyltransferase
MHPPIKTMLVSCILFFEIYFLVVITAGMHVVRIGMQEFVGALTVFVFLLSLRIADDFKDYKTDRVLFPHRPLPSGRVYKRDLVILLIITNSISIALNLIFMNNLLFFAFLMGYGALMSVWFFARTKIQKNLPLALITHNPIQLVLNAYMISFACAKYNLSLFTFDTLIIAFTLYWPGLLWEIARKTRAPRDETAYTTYSKLFGVKKVVLFLLIVMAFDVLTSGLLMWQLWRYGVVFVIGAYIWLLFSALKFKKNPEKFTLVSRVEIYELITEVPVLAIELIYLLGGWIR